MAILTSSPVQNMGHLSHGDSLALPNQVLRYGVRTVRGNTGGLSFEAPTGSPNSAEPAATTRRSQCITLQYTVYTANIKTSAEMKEKVWGYMNEVGRRVS